MLCPRRTANEFTDIDPSLITITHEEEGVTMPPSLSSTTIEQEIFTVASNQNCQPTATIANHKMYIAANCRIDETWAVEAPHKWKMTGTQSPTGPIYYLPYFENQICSMRLPSNPPPGATKFLTANMTGCRLFVDTIAGSQDIIVYHANTKAHGWAPGQPFNAQSNAASQILTGLHATAQADYANLNPAVIAAPRTSLAKYTYLMPGEAAALRKQNKHGRSITSPVRDTTTDIDVYTPGQKPEYVGAATICGFFGGNSWRFYYQTWGYIDYERRSGVAEVAKSLVKFQWQRVHNLRTKGTTASTLMKVMDHQEIL